ncbi:HAD family hydrolase [Neptunicoccus cionae]|uniref:phosphoglycolate phosphatase n=1 Tax=Neptunicoccus cionae TaxID=2035344 RepID=A0A916VMK5_9RHOB|nr:HAD family hydrolase [Amylibacter cionae]GGA08728.1 phosphatase [Amylibacter cionae]
MTIKGLVFDKDGTLFHYGATWLIWCDLVLEDLSQGDPEKKKELADAVGFDLENNSFLPGSLIVNASAGEINGVWASLLPDFSDSDVDAVAVKHLGSLPSVPVCDLKELFSALRGQGYALGLVTNDYEEGAYQQLKQEGIADLFDFVAGFDSGHGVKPGAGPLLAFGAATGLTMAQVAMVGDSTHDLGAGRAAKVAMNIGVLTGPAETDDIAHLADVVLQDISGIAAVLR